MIRTIIIDDESQALSALKQEIEFNCDNIDIVGESTNVKDAVKLIKQLEPELLFLDIQLSDGLGFDILKQVKGYDLNVIFTTAYSEYALKALKLSAIDYLLKPIDGSELMEAVQKVIANSSFQFEKKFDNYISNNSLDNSQKRIALHSSKGIDLFELRTIIRCKSEGNYTRFYFENGKKLLLSKSMGHFEKLLCPFGFQRIHHSHIINMTHLSSYKQKDGGYVEMSNKTEIPVAQRRKSSFLASLNDMI